jgi:hypothetical protein
MLSITIPDCFIFVIRGQQNSCLPWEKKGESMSGENCRALFYLRSSRIVVSSLTIMIDHYHTNRKPSPNNQDEFSRFQIFFFILSLLSNLPLALGALLL